MNTPNAFDIAHLVRDIALHTAVQPYDGTDISDDEYAWVYATWDGDYLASALVSIRPKSGDAPGSWLAIMYSDYDVVVPEWLHPATPDTDTCEDMMSRWSYWIPKAREVALDLVTERNRQEWARLRAQTQSPGQG